ncbi:hypothetical protein COU57_05050 [Candidatus Pacearchaeota archaeon CG10_big_fil_rev_8_21_14_0_10_32_14]|nr:MAG: hypothetical protein COU57_05050 [Candidatus Pacearchaeota archaeon CG10_big_fil_rev_8_21_14_0_10_32_14]
MKTPLKSLKPSMKENKRYLVVGGKVSKENIEKAILEFIGVNGMSKTGLSFIKSENGKMIIAVNREAVDSVRASLCIYREKMEVVNVSGTIKGLGNNSRKT